VDDPDRIDMAANTADDARWEALLASEEGQALLEKLAAEALAENEAGRALPMTFDSDGSLRPEAVGSNPRLPDETG
jgi:hypothetical protein